MHADFLLCIAKTSADCRYSFRFLACCITERDLESIFFCLPFFIRRFLAENVGVFIRWYFDTFVVESIISIEWNYNILVIEFPSQICGSSNRMITSEHCWDRLRSQPFSFANISNVISQSPHSTTSKANFLLYKVMFSMIFINRVAVTDVYLKQMQPFPCYANV